MVSITYNSAQQWLIDHDWMVERYLRKNHADKDHDLIKEQMIMLQPDEAVMLVRNFNLPEKDKKLLFIQWLVLEPQITCGIFSDQRQGKDAFVCAAFEDCIDYCKSIGKPIPRVVTLGNIRKPPFVAEKDMYFSFKDIPSGRFYNGQVQEVWIYCSEIETVISSRESSGPEQRLYSQLEGTMAQNYQKLFGCSKLAAKVDINFIRSLNTKIIKYIDVAKLMIENVERENIISNLAQWHRPMNKYDKSEVLLLFDMNIFKVRYGLPGWWTEDYSHQFLDIPMDKILEYIDVQISNNMKINNIQIAVAQKFRKNISLSVIKERFSMQE